jgi:hypothetical protein
MKKEIDAALSPILGSPDTIEGPVGPSAVAVAAEIGLDKVAGSPGQSSHYKHGPHCPSRGRVEGFWQRTCQGSEVLGPRCTWCTCGICRI